MRKILFAVLTALLTTVSEKSMAQTYHELWKEVETAAQSDLPQTQRKALGQIVKKASKEAQYGQLLKALLQDGKVAAMLSPDSLNPFVEQLKTREQQEKNVPLKAVCQTALAYIYEHNHSLDDQWQQIALDYKQKAMSHPAELAAVKAADYEPFVEKGGDSHVFDNDLLSVIGYETEQYEALHQYYLTTPNRRAQLLTALKTLEEPMALSNISRIDSLISLYGDLTECGEAAILRFRLMQSSDKFSAREQMEFIDQSLSRWGTWKRMNALRNARNTLTSRCFTATIPSRVFIPNREQQVVLSNLRGISSLTVTLYRVDIDGNTQLNPNYDNEYKRLKPLLTQLPQTVTRHYEGHAEYELFSDTVSLAALPVGVYMVEIATQPGTEVSRQLYFVSDVRVLVQSQPGNAIRYVTVSATTGQPLAGVSLRLRTYESRQRSYNETLVTTNAKGEYLYTYKVNRPTDVFATLPTDRACPMVNAYGGFSYYEGQRDMKRGQVMTDRAIYRPGQTVHTAAILYQVKNGFEHQALSGKQVKAVLYDANYEVVTERMLTTDAYGTVSTDFVLPSSGLTGNYHVSIGNYQAYFQVEEYKRPTFRVELPKPEQDYKAGDTLTVKGKALTYAGVPVQGARVSYRVERRRAWWWFSYYRYWNMGVLGNSQLEMEVYRSEALTDENGQFDVLMPMVMPETESPLFCNFVVVADVTDTAGETHHGELSLPLGNRKTALTVDLEEKILAESKPVMTFHLRNAAGTDLNETVSYRIDGGAWQTAATRSAVAVWQSQLKSGQHELEAICAGDTLKKSFVVFSLNDKRPATETDDWFYVSANQFPNDGTPVTLQVGSSAKNVHIVYTIVSGNRVIESGSVDKSNELVNRKFTYKKEYENGLVLCFAWVKEGKTYQHSTTLRRPLPDKQLRMTWETFRDRLTPGQQEEWTLKVLSPEGKPLAMSPQLMAVLYDKSLDQIVSHSWQFEPFVYLPLPSVRWSYGSWGGAQLNGAHQTDFLPEPALEYNHFDRSCYPMMWRGRGPLLYKSMSLARTKSAAVRGKAVTDEMLEQSNTAIGTFDVAASDEAEGEPLAELKVVEQADGAGDRMKLQGSDTDEPVQLRENLQETAFFYPQLSADSTGRVTVKFTLPESLTTWRFMGLAHTSDLMYGLLEGESVAKKDVMIQPNVPRFVRVSDEATISARIFNTGDHEVSGTARLVLSDPESGNVIHSEQTTCSLQANGTAAVTFKVDAAKFAAYSLLVCKMTVSGETFSDGEQHYLPVLPNHERVTVTVPFTQTQPGVKTVDLQSLIPQSALTSSMTPKFTIEYTNNPAWFMIQALPAVGQPHDLNVISQTASLYANSLGRYILRQNPQAKHVFEQWKHETGSASLQSPLSKNEELKDLMLSETPWVMDAEREAEQKQRLADFFDTNLMDTRMASAVEKVQQLQNGDGSWNWWPGMRGSFYMTVAVSEMLVRLQTMTGEASPLRAQLDKAFGYMDNEIVKLVEEMKKEEKKGHRQVFPSQKALQYLYLSTLDGRKPTGKVAASHAYLKNLLQKEGRTLSLYDKALASIVLNSTMFVKSLKEYTVYKEGMGRYYDTPRAGYSWRDYRIPTQVAAIEAFKRLTPGDTTIVAEMQQWLLQEKRTQAWDTPVNSVDAVYAFFDGNSRVLKSQEKTALTVDGTPLATSQATAGLGYVKTVVTQASPKTFEAKKTATGTSWGAVYAQFEQPTRDIADQSSEVSVKREIFIAGTNSPLSSLHSPLKVGSRITVRLTIVAQRDLDFVEVTDRRAACMEPVQQLSGYHRGAYCSPKDNATCYYYDVLPKGKHVIETEYYLDRAGRYETGTCTVQCAYAPEFRGTTHSQTITITE